jgi:hypothetical protein
MRHARSSSSAAVVGSARHTAALHCCLDKQLQLLAQRRAPRTEAHREQDMHTPDGYLAPPFSVGMGVASHAAIVGGRHASRQQVADQRTVPLLATGLLGAGLIGMLALGVILWGIGTLIIMRKDGEADLTSPSGVST